MAKLTRVFRSETFRFFKELGHNNRKAWMDENRERYQATVVEPFRHLLEELSPAMLELDSRFGVSGRTGSNFSRINRDIRFAKDKTPYKTQMYLKFSVPAPGNGETGQLYVGLSMNTVTAGFRIYSGGKRKESVLATIGQARVQAKPGWVAKQKKRLSRRYESYWYTTQKGEWTKHSGWPVAPENWDKILAWIVRCKRTPAAATRPAFPRDLIKVFRELYPLLRYTSLPD
ncbi:MAG: hypothetical protein DMG42_19410 [Acidobacteria bacterium]|nr:MAG: hypothetical protein AUH13_06190 [Acidobacteria bacterium 13_2_20CM_58_27]PYT70366.1 MAG: hypothetical protein DMG42_19410 [Acidobacteriota bacterium]